MCLVEEVQGSCWRGAWESFVKLLGASGVSVVRSRGMGML